MRVLVCGSRHWYDPKPIYRELSAFPPDTVVMHGGCQGADTHAGIGAKALGMRVEVYPARWHLYGLAAGPLRNAEMLRQKPDLVLAFHDDLRKSRGTLDMVRRAQEAGVPVRVVTQ